MLDSCNHSRSGVVSGEIDSKPWFGLSGAYEVRMCCWDKNWSISHLWLLFHLTSLPANSWSQSKPWWKTSVFRAVLNLKASKWLAWESYRLFGRWSLWLGKFQARFGLLGSDGWSSRLMFFGDSRSYWFRNTGYYRWCWDGWVRNHNVMWRRNWLIVNAIDQHWLMWQRCCCHGWRLRRRRWQWRKRLGHLCLDWEKWTFFEFRRQDWDCGLRSIWTTVEDELAAKLLVACLMTSYKLGSPSRWRLATAVDVDWTSEPNGSSDRSVSSKSSSSMMTSVSSGAIGCSTSRWRSTRVSSVLSSDSSATGAAWSYITLCPTMFLSSDPSSMDTPSNSSTERRNFFLSLAVLKCSLQGLLPFLALVSCFLALDNAFSCWARQSAPECLSNLWRGHHCLMA